MAFSLPNFVVPISLWRWSHWIGTVPPVGAADVLVNCNLTPGRRNFDVADSLYSYVLVPFLSDIRFSQSGIAVGGVFVDPDLAEIPTGSGRFYLVADVEYSGLGFANQHQVARLKKLSPWPAGAIPPVVGELLLEDATDYLLEDNTLILLE